MKNIKYWLILFVIATVSCADYLDIVPDDIPTIDYAFSDRYRAEGFLYTCYSYLPNVGDAATDPAIAGGDEYWVDEVNNQNERGYIGNFIPCWIKQNGQNAGNPLMNYWSGEYNGRNLYTGIRDCNIFLEKIGNVGKDLKAEERQRWISEILFLKAYYHYYLLRMYGPIPLIRENLSVDAQTESVRLYRDTFDDCVDYIVSLIDQSIPNLPVVISDITTEMGRITKPIALSVKAELLVMAASPLFNGNPDYVDIADNRGVKLFPSKAEGWKWERAAIACKNAIDTCHLANISLYEFIPDQQNISTTVISDTTKLIMTLRHVAMEKWNREIIWGNSRGNIWNLQRIALPFFNTQQAIDWSASRPLLAPTLRMAELFYSNHGVPIEDDISWTQDYANRYKTSMSPESHKFYIEPGFETARLHLNREARFYANLTFDGNYWFGNGRYKDMGKGTSDETPWLVKMKKGDPAGNITGLRYSQTGYWCKKAVHFRAEAKGTDNLSAPYTSYPIMRLADLYLLYAEALNESQGPNEEVYYYTDLVRKRAGLDGVVDSWRNYSRYGETPVQSKRDMRTIIQWERMIELAFEGKRFWDIRRWKTAQELMNTPVRGWNVAGATTSEYYNVVPIYSLKFMTREYLWPIKQSELRTNQNLVQNYGW